LNFSEFTIKNYIKDDDEKENNNEFRLLNYESEAIKENYNDRYNDSKSQTKLPFKDLPSKKYETTRENRKPDSEYQNYNVKSDSLNNKKNKSTEKDNFLNNLTSKNKKDPNQNNSKNKSNKDGIIFRIFLIYY
jgi:hypothetical protein